MTERLNDLTKTLTILIANRDLIRSSMPDLTEDDKAAILGPLGDSIADCDFLMKAAYDESDGLDTMERDERTAYLGDVL